MVGEGILRQTKNIFLAESTQSQFEGYMSKEYVKDAIYVDTVAKNEIAWILCYYFIYPIIDYLEVLNRYFPNF